MASAFDVTVVPTSLQVTAGQSGDVEVTVSNKSGRALTAHGIRSAEPKTAIDWLQPSGADQAPLAAGETRKIRYTVTVPAGTASQTVRFRVDVADVTDPNAYYTQGPTFAVTVQPATTPHRDPWLKRNWPYIAAAVVILAVGFGIYELVKPKGPGNVPRVRGLAFDSAQAVLTRAGLAATRSDTLASDTVRFRPGVVVTQLPDSGAKPPKDKKVALTVQKAWGVVPPVAGRPLATATRAIANQNLVIAAVFQNTTNPALDQTAINTVPDSNAFLPAGATVTLNVWTAVSRCRPWPQCAVRATVNVIEELNRATQARARMLSSPVRQRP